MLFLNWAPRHEDVLGSEGISPGILDLGTRRRWIVSFTPRPLYPGERTSGTQWIGGLVGPRAGLDTVVGRKIPSHSRESSPWIPGPQRVASSYTDWATPALEAVMAYFKVLSQNLPRQTENNPEHVITYHHHYNNNYCNRHRLSEWEWNRWITMRVLFCELGQLMGMGGGVRCTHCRFSIDKNDLHSGMELGMLLIILELCRTFYWRDAVHSYTTSWQFLQWTCGNTFYTPHNLYFQE
jgi:hypothetical protein